MAQRNLYVHLEAKTSKCADNFVAIPPIHFGRQDLLIESQLIS
jgi:hypothetical protein